MLNATRNRVPSEERGEITGRTVVLMLATLAVGYGAMAEISRPNFENKTVDYMQKQVSPLAHEDGFGDLRVTDLDSSDDTSMRFAGRVTLGECSYPVTVDAVGKDTASIPGF